MRKNTIAVEHTDDNRQEQEHKGQARKSARRGRRIQKAILRGIVAAYLTVVLVLVGIIPEGGIPAVIAAGPSKGSVTVYKYVRMKTLSDILRKDDVYHPYLLTYYYGGQYYSPYTNVLADDNWPVTRTDSLFTHYDNQADEFYSRNHIYHNIKCTASPLEFGPDGNNKSHGLYIFTKNNGYDERNSKTGMRLTYRNEGNKIQPHESTWPVFLFSGHSGFRIQFWYGHGSGNNYKSVPGLNFLGDSTHIYGRDPDANEYSEFYFYEVQSNAYTCINRNYTIGSKENPQVYTAEADLFLQEGVTLTVPEGSVLCVKKGRFFVNGEIKCAGTILVEDGGIIEPFESTGSGSRIILEEGGTMIIRKGGKVFAGCPAGALGTPEGNGWLDMYAGSSIINYGLLIAGQCNFSYGQATIENHKDAILCLGCSIDTYSHEKDFLNFSQNNRVILDDMKIGWYDYRVVGASTTGGRLYLGKDDKTTVLKTWDGAFTYIKNKSTDSKYGKSVKSYSYDKNGKCKISTYTP